MRIWIDLANSPHVATFEPVVERLRADGAEVLLGPGESIDVAIGQAHRICNAEDDVLVVVEVQLGDYTGEDDIVRLEDDYDRCAAR